MGGSTIGSRTVVGTSGAGDVTGVEAELRRFIEDEILDGEKMEGDPLQQGLLDSLAIELVLDFILTTYGVEFEDEELVAENFSSLDQVAGLVEARRARVDE